MRAYVDVLRFEDRIWGHEFYQAAADGLIKSYLFLYDNPAAAKTDLEEPDYSSMSAAERKKAKAIARKKKKSAERETQSKDGNGQSRNPGSVHDDPRGELLLKRDPLEEAKKYVNTLVNSAPNCISTWLLRYDVAIRRQKMLMALQVSEEGDVANESKSFR